MKKYLKYIELSLLMTFCLLLVFNGFDVRTHQYWLFLFLFMAFGTLNYLEGKSDQ